MQEICPASAVGMGCYRYDDGGKYFHNLFISHALTLLVVKVAYRFSTVEYNTKMYVFILQNAEIVQNYMHLNSTHFVRV